MEFQQFISIFWQQFKATSLIEWFAVGFGVTEVILAKRNNIWLYPFGIVSILLAIYLKINGRLYAEILLSVYYLLMSFYGWALWSKLKKSNLPPIKISWTTRKELFVALAISIIGYFVLYTFLVCFTNSDVPILDAFVSSTAWAGMWLLARRKIENWLFLNISNIVAIPLMWHKQYVLFTLLTLFLFIVAIFGFLDWKKKYEEDRVASNL